MNIKKTTNFPPLYLQCLVGIIQSQNPVLNPGLRPNPDLQALTHSGRGPTPAAPHCPWAASPSESPLSEAKAGAADATLNKRHKRL